MVESPAINRENYVVFTAYTREKDVYEKAPVVSGKELPAIKKTPDYNGIEFAGCYANLKARKNSVILPTWCDFTLGWNTGLSIKTSKRVDYDVHDDPTYQVKNGEVVKFYSPWMVTTNKPEVDWVAAKSLYNKTVASIPSGITAWDNNLFIWPIFIFIPKAKDYYVHMEMNTPLMSFYPLTNMPLHVESYYDPKKVEELFHKQMNAMELRNFASFYQIRKAYEKKTCPQNVS